MDVNFLKVAVGVILIGAGVVIMGESGGSIVKLIGGVILIGIGIAILNSSK